MNEYFDNLHELERIEFLGRVGKHTFKRKKTDRFEPKTFFKLVCAVCAESLIFYVGALNQKGVSKLILPHHDAEHKPNQNPDREVQPGGEPFDDVMKKYREDYVPNRKFPKSIGKIRSQQSRFFGDADLLLRADVLFVSNDKELVHEGHYNDNHGEDKIYIGNGFHRFVVYGLWIAQNGFKPLEVYYVQSPR